MARRPVVIQGPPKAKPRTPVVVREGRPPRDKRNLMDTAMGVAGGLLLLLAVALFGILPDEEEPPRFFQVTYEETVIEDAEVKNFDMSEGSTIRVPLPVDSANVYSIQITVEFGEDEPTTLPDTFAFEILDPNSEAAMDEVRHDTPTPESDGNPIAPTFTASTARQILTVEIAPPPTDGPQPPSSDDEDLANAKARIQDETQTRAPGEWALDIRLVDAGDCPQPTDPEGPAHATACQAAVGQEGDPGNSIQIVKVSFTTYDAMVTE